VGAPLVCIVPNPSIDRTAEVDRLEPGRIHRPESVVAVPGGKGLNVARAAQGLGLPVEAVSLLAGHAGRWIADELDRIGLAHRDAWTAGETRSCLSILDRSTGLLTEIYEPGPAVAAPEWDAFLEAIGDAARAAGPGALIALSGSLPRGVPSDAAAAIVRSAASAGGRCLVDTSGPHLAAALTARPFLVKVNATEAAPVLERPVADEAAAVEAAAEIVGRGAGSAVITRGAAGAVGWDGASAWAVDPPPGAGAHTVGSGDAFLAGLAAGLRSGDPLPECLRRAAAVAAASTRVAGTGNVDATAIDELFDRTAVRRLA
jgi:1-phosphofructokinase family hexose kinase